MLSHQTTSLSPDAFQKSVIEKKQKTAARLLVLRRNCIKDLALARGLFLDVAGELGRLANAAGESAGEGCWGSA